MGRHDTGIDLKKNRQDLESSISDVGPDLVSKHAVCSCFNTSGFLLQNKIISSGELT
jgi:hypothetical protein